MSNERSLADSDRQLMIAVVACVLIIFGSISGCIYFYHARSMETQTKIGTQCVISGNTWVQNQGGQYECRKS
jgi:ABC-type phosphate transport system permease subunit